MAGRYYLRTEGLEKLRRELEPRAQALIAKGAEDIQERAQDIVVEKNIIDTGALHNSIAARQKEPFKWWVLVGVEYGIYHELGTRRMRARPFLLPALEQVRPKFLAAWKQLIRM